jgi:hypothetical protein
LTLKIFIKKETNEKKKKIKLTKTLIYDII